MNKFFDEKILPKWEDELKEYLNTNKSLLVVLFNSNSEMLYTNHLAKSIFHTKIKNSLVNPDFDELTKLTPINNKIFEGFITTKSEINDNYSFWAIILKKNDEFLLLAGDDIISVHNKSNRLYELNDEINSLQRDLLKEKRKLNETNLELDKLNKELQEANATKNRFFNIIAHDLISPFNTLIGFSKIIVDSSEKYSKDEIVRFASFINDVAINTHGLLDNLLTWARIENGKLHPVFTEINSTEIFEEVYNIYVKIANSKGIELKMDNTVDCTIRADRNMLLTILRNLVSNAIKFTFPGGQISIESKLVTNKLEISVKDNGKGISDENFDKIFNIDKEFTSQGTANEKGSGLGLVLVHDFLKLHGSEIQLETEIGKGTKFKFKLPITNL